MALQVLAGPFFHFIAKFLLYNAALADVPQAQRPLRVPAPVSLQKIFPGDAQHILEASQQTILFSLNPVDNSEGYDTPLGASLPKQFHGHDIMGQTVVVDTKTKAELLASFYDAMVSPPVNGLKQIGMGCFMPRHGLRATLDGQTVELLLCFSCHKFQLFRGAQQIRENFITDMPRPTFDRILTQPKIPFSY